MLYPNGQRVLGYPGRHVAGALVASGAMAYGGIHGARLNRFVSGTYSKVVGGLPSGYGAKSYVFPVKAGGVGGGTSIGFAPSGLLVGGVTSTGAADLSISVADAQMFPLDDTPPARTASASFSFTVSGVGGLIATASGSALMSFTVADALLVATVGASGSANFALTTNTPILGAIAGGSGSASMTFTVANAQAYPLNDASPLRSGSAVMSFSGSLQPYAVGRMEGSTVDNSVLTVDTIASAVWQSLAATYSSPGTMGNALATASTGGVDVNLLVSEVLAALQATTIPVNVKAINSTPLTGSGTAGDAWGPA